MNIGQHRIGVDAPYVIAEIGSNHDNDLETARLMISLAANAGASAAKFQFYRADQLYPGVLTPGAIPDEWLPLLKDHCTTVGVDFLCSVFCLETLVEYLKLEPVAVKIAAPEAAHWELVAAACVTGVPLLLSTGAMSWADIEAMPLLHDDVALLHCVSAYPAPAAEMNLHAIPEMSNRYGQMVGLSDHSLNPTAAPVAAVALGATIIEKHITRDRSLPGADHSFALEPAEFRQMAVAVRQAWLMLGDGDKRVTASEDPRDRR
jgi:sialic acid synthase SpsE